MYLCILLFPLLSFLFTNLFGRFLGIFGCCFFSTLSIFSSFLLSLVAFYEVGFCGAPCFFSLGAWLCSDLINSFWGFCFDSISAIMLVVVCSVSFLVHFYSIEYMWGDPHQGRFMGYLSLFTFFMLILVSADNFVVMFLGWEGIGLASYLLISFWFTRIQAGKSAVKAMLVNRVGDLGLVLAICAIFFTFKSSDYFVVFALSPCAVDLHLSFLSMSFDRLSLIAFLIFFGALGKSAQLGLHIWLPDAMEGPTPVSALIHAATLVTAGVFLIIRCSFLFEHCPNVLFLVTLVGSLTAFFAASVGLVQNDLKRVIAYSTCSQLGYMVFACGLSHYSVAFFHLANHAFFKALLFLSAGSIIHGLADEQDLRKMGGLSRFFPVSYAMVVIGSLALTGIPFLTGFYSKDAVLEVAVSRYTFIGNFAYILGCLAAFFTAFYSCRLIFLVFLNKPNGFKKHFEGVHEPTLFMLLPLLLLALGSVFFGFFFKEFFLGLGSGFFRNAIFVAFTPTMLDAEFLNPAIKNIPLFFTLTGYFLSFILIFFDQNTNSLSKPKLILGKTFFARKLYIFLSKKWHFDQLANEWIAHKLMLFGDNVTFRLLDKGNVEFYGPFGLASLAFKFSAILSFFHSGQVSNYLLAFFCSFTFIFCVFNVFGKSFFTVFLLILSHLFFNFFFKK